jgi:hypothetical protein
MARIFVIVIGSFNLPCFYEFIRMRKMQLNKYKIPHMFVFDSPIPETYTPDSTDVFFEKVSKPYPVENQKNMHSLAMPPHMSIKFLKSLQHIDETQYDYIIRCNLSTFIHFPKLIEYLETITIRPYAGGRLMKFQLPDWAVNPHDPIEFISGTCMIFSSDVIRFFKAVPIHSYILYEHEDDVVLSFLAKLVSNKFYNIPMVLLENDRYPEQGEIDSFALFRIKHYIDRDKDVEKWRFLLAKLDNLL